MSNDAGRVGMFTLSPRQGAERGERGCGKRALGRWRFPRLVCRHPVIFMRLVIWWRARETENIVISAGQKRSYVFIGPPRGFPQGVGDVAGCSGGTAPNPERGVGEVACYRINVLCCHYMRVALWKTRSAIDFILPAIIIGSGGK
jgi:hypothetical protein